MLVHPWDAGTSDEEWRAFVIGQGFGQLIASGRGRDRPVVVPTQFVLVDNEVWLHLARPNPIWRALEENPIAMLSVAGDWAFVPSAWKAIGDEDPALGIPTTYYAAVQLSGEATVVDDPAGTVEILRRQLASYEPGSGAVDPSEHTRLLPGIRGLRLSIQEVTAKFKYGGNVDAGHRAAVAEHLADRAGPGDTAALGQLLRRSTVDRTEHLSLQGLHHVQLAIPPDSEDECRRFWGAVLGMAELEKPPVLAARGGCWFRGGGLEVHLGVEDDFVPARKAHPGILVSGLDSLASRLAAAGIEIRWDGEFPGHRRFYADDPFGNRLEFLEPEAS
jgi:transcriptional regulator